MLSILSEIEVLVKDTLFPHKCLCGKLDEVLCSKCFDSIKKNKKDLCPICRKLSNNGKTCDRCKPKSFLTGVMIHGTHEGVIKDAIWSYKYESILELSKPLSKLLIEKYGNHIKLKNFLITNVPISKERHRLRGYNQSAELAKLISKGLDLQYIDTLTKLDASPQVGLSRKMRIENIKNKIKLVKNIDLKNKKILLVDDVYTTGSTLEECAKILRVAGAREVWGIVLTRD